MSANKKLSREEECEMAIKSDSEETLMHRKVKDLPPPLAERQLSVRSRTSITSIEPEADFRRDIPSIALLFFLYILQGIPLGLIQTIPFLLQSRKVPYTEQAKFSLAFYPFSFKVLYAPIVDAFYWKRLGRRKSWLVPMQYLISAFLFVLTFQIDELLDNKNVGTITAVFFILNFLAASQDISVDGWALTMLSKGNVGYASTCNAVGQTLGAVISYSGFLALNSETFANNYFRKVPSEGGLVTLPQFLFFWAIVFAITTTLILIFKKEEPETDKVSEQHMDILGSYGNLWKILKLKNIHYLIAFYLTANLGSAAAGALATLKLVEKGVPKEQVAFFSIPLIPIKLLIPIIISKFTVGNNSMGVWMYAYPVGLLFGLIYPIIIFWTPGFALSDGQFSYSYYILLFFIFAAQLLPGYTKFVAGMAFSAKVSDPAIGGTYMTLINTVSNVGSMWTTSVSLWLVDYVAIPLGNDCLGNGWDKYFQDMRKLNESGKGADVLNKTFYSLGGSSTIRYEDVVNLNSSMEGVPTCSNIIDGYYVECAVCIVLGFLWMAWGRPTILRLQKMPLKSWRVFH